MKKNITLILVVLVVGVAGWGLGRFTHPGFELRVEVTESGASLSSTKGCSWTSASYSGEGETYAFEVTNNGVKSTGQIIAER